MGLNGKEMVSRWLMVFLSCVLMVSAGLSTSPVGHSEVRAASGCCASMPVDVVCKCGCPCVKATPDLPAVADVALPTSFQFAILPVAGVGADVSLGLDSRVIPFRRDAFSPQRPRAPDSARAPPVSV